MQNLRRICQKIALKMSKNCAENALKLRAICAICAQIELKNPRKITQKFRVNTSGLLKQQTYHCQGSKER